MAAEKTEKATPKRREDARKEGQVARSADLGAAVVLLAGLLALSAFGPRIVAQAEASIRWAYGLIATPEVVDRGGLGTLLATAGGSVALAVLPLALLSIVAGVGVSVAQVGWKPSPKAVKPNAKRINPLQGAKNIFGPNGLFEGGKTLAKFAIIGAIAAFAVLPKLTEVAALVGLPPEELLRRLARTVLGIAERAAAAYLLIAVLDYAWQRRRHEKQLRMDKHEVKEEMKQHVLPPEVKSALRRRQMQAARARMMAAVPDADVVVTNPTHYAVALVYDGTKPAPEVVAKGQDLVALRIREIAEESGVPVISDPPLARTLHRSVEVGRQIPEELYQAVAQLLVFVYRVARRRAV